jgi:glycosyltransferase involved in cell wall biosynthesis
VLDVFVLVKDRREFTELTLKFLFEHTDFAPVHRLVFVDDGSTDGADEACRRWIAKNGIGELVRVRGGSVTNALFLGSARYLEDPVRFLVKIDNDMILSEDWLTKVLVQAERCGARYDVIGFTTVNEFFPSTPEEIWTERAPEDYSLVEVPYTGGNFLMRWDAFRRFRHLGVSPNPAHYIVGSLSEVHRALNARGLLKLAILAPHLPVFKLDKVATAAYDRYRFFERRGIDRAWVEERIEEYFRAGMCRKRLVAGRVVNAF